MSLTGSSKKCGGVYIVNFDNNAGFAVVSADKRDRVKVYLASEQGSFDENGDVSQILLPLVQKYQNATIATHEFNPDKGDGVSTVTDIVEESYGPLLKTCWHQEWPFNKELYNRFNCHIPVGCVPVAIGQIINYY